MDFKILVATESHTKYAPQISTMISEASLKRGTGIANRTASYIEQKMLNKHAIVALYQKEIVGFCYIETWSHHKYVANSGLIVAENFQHKGLAAKIKRKAFELSKELYPNSKLFGITTSLPVMKINSALGYKPVTFSELTDDQAFWDGCKGCKNIDILKRNNHKMCLCTAMLYESTKEAKTKEPSTKRWDKFKLFMKQRAKRIKKFKLEKYV